MRQIEAKQIEATWEALPEGYKSDYFNHIHRIEVGDEYMEVTHKHSDGTQEHVHISGWEGRYAAVFVEPENVDDESALCANVECPVARHHFAHELPYVVEMEESDYV